MLDQEERHEDGATVTEGAGASLPLYTATYSAEDNKLRLYTVRRLDRETYDRVHAAGFAWAPKQELFVAPKWTPEREDLLLELAGDIDDEETPLADRAAERAERFEVYSDKRGDEAESARAYVERIAGGIPMGQPILVGHHSERHARRDAKRIENGMRAAVRLHETSAYWEHRATRVTRHAAYKADPGLRARRIKVLEAEERSAPSRAGLVDRRARPLDDHRGDRGCGRAARARRSQSRTSVRCHETCGEHFTDGKTTVAEACAQCLAHYPPRIRPRGEALARAPHESARVRARAARPCAGREDEGGPDAPGFGGAPAPELPSDRGRDRVAGRTGETESLHAQVAMTAAEFKRASRRLQGNACLIDGSHRFRVATCVRSEFVASS